MTGGGANVLASVDFFILKEFTSIILKNLDNYCTF